MSSKDVFVIILCVIAVLLLAYAFYLYSTAKKKVEKATQKVSGRIVDYKKVTGDYKVPLVRYIVDNKEYFQQRVFAGYEFTNDHAVKESKALLTDQDILRIRNGKTAMKSIEALYPRNSVLMVHYDPENPQESYVEKYSPMYTKAYIPGLFGLCFVVAAIIVKIFI